MSSTQQQTDVSVSRRHSTSRWPKSRPCESDCIIGDTHSSLESTILLRIRSSVYRRGAYKTISQRFSFRCSSQFFLERRRCVKNTSVAVCRLNFRWNIPLTAQIPFINILTFLLSSPTSCGFRIPTPALGCRLNMVNAWRVSQFLTHQFIDYCLGSWENFLMAFFSYFFTAQFYDEHLPGTFQFSASPHRF